MVTESAEFLSVTNMKEINVSIYLSTDIKSLENTIILNLARKTFGTRLHVPGKTLPERIDSSYSKDCCFCAHARGIR